MSYSRKEVQDGVTVMNKELYDNLQDGIDETKEAIEVLNTVFNATVEDEPSIE